MCDYLDNQVNADEWYRSSFIQQLQGLASFQEHPTDGPNLLCSMPKNGTVELSTFKFIESAEYIGINENA